MEFSSQSKGVVFYLSPLTYAGSSLSTELASDQILFAPSNTIIQMHDQKVLTIKPGTSDATFLLPKVELTQFTLMVLYKIKSGTIASPINIATLGSSLLVASFSTTSVTFGSCLLAASFTAGRYQGDWHPLGVTYTGNTLRAYIFEQVEETACVG